MSVDQDLALARPLLHQQQPQERGLAGAARAGQEDELALPDGQRQVTQRVDAAVVQLREVLRLDHGEWRPRVAQGVPVRNSANARSIRPIESISLVSSRFASGGLALPPLRFITWPTRNPSVCFLPARYWATASAFSANDRPHDGEHRVLVADLRQALGRDDVAGGPPGREHRREHVLGDRPADRALLDEADERRQRRRPQRGLLHGPSPIVQRAQQLAHHPVAGRLRAASPPSPRPRSTPPAAGDCVRTPASYSGRP